MDAGEETAMLAAPSCPGCGARIVAREALCDDWRDPTRSLGCPQCGLWLVRNGRMRVYWGRLVPVLLLLPTFGAAMLALARTAAGQWWAAPLEILAMPLFGGVGVAWVQWRCVRRVGPPLLPADGTRAVLPR